MRTLLLFLGLVLLALQWRLWNREGGIPEVRYLEQQIEQQQTHNQALESDNDYLIHRIDGLKNDADELEQRARQDLGLIHRDETWVPSDE